MGQREALMEHLGALENVELSTQARSNLNELLYTAIETGVLEHVDTDQALLIVQIVALAVELDDDFPRELRM